MAGWKSLIVYLGIHGPLLLTIAPSPALLASVFGAEAGEKLVGGIDILVWMPVLLDILGLIVGRRNLPRGTGEWVSFVRGVAPRYKDIGATLVFSFAGSAVLLK